MRINLYLFLSKYWKLVTVLLIIILGFSTLVWRKNDQTEQLKLKLERERIGQAFKQAGIAAAKLQQAQNIQIKKEEDELAPHEISGDAELAQARLWQTLPKSKREILRTETINAGLEAARKEQSPPSE